MKDIEDKVKEVIEILFKKTNKTLPFPTITYDLKGYRVHGTAWNGSHKIQFNLNSYNHDKEKFLNTVVPHEVAHLFNYVFFNGDGHDRSWKNIMRVLGLQPERCTNFNITNYKRQERLEYRCNCMSHFITKNKHSRIVNGARYFCVHCKIEIKRYREIS